MTAISETSQATLRQMIDGYRVSQIICIAAELGIADKLAAGAQHYKALAAETKTHAPSLLRLLRALTSTGIFMQAGEGYFALNPLAELLRSDAAGSLRPWALLSASAYRTWGHLDHSIKTGETTFDHLHGMDSWTYRERHPEEAQIFNDAMSAHIALVAKAIVKAYDFSPFTSILDVGGGHGTLLAAILSANPGARGILFDIPAAIREAKAMLEPAALGSRCQLVEGSFFDFVPSGADAYILSRILHDWNDDQVAQILATLRKAVKHDAKLLIIERVLDPENPAAETTLSDLHMLVRVGGRERTIAEFQGLLALSDFALVQTWPTSSPFCIIEAVPNY